MGETVRRLGTIIQKHFLCPIRSQNPPEFLEIARWQSVPRGSFARTWKFSPRLFSRLDWLPLGLRGCFPAKHQAGKAWANLVKWSDISSDHSWPEVALGVRLTMSIATLRKRWPALMLIRGALSCFGRIVTFSTWTAPPNVILNILPQVANKTSYALFLESSTRQGGQLKDRRARCTKFVYETLSAKQIRWYTTWPVTSFPTSKHQTVLLHCDQYDNSLRPPPFTSPLGGLIPGLRGKGKDSIMLLGRTYTVPWQGFHTDKLNQHGISPVLNWWILVPGNTWQSDVHCYATELDDVPPRNQSH